MAHSNNGLIYVDTTTSPNKGVSIADVQAVIWDNHTDLGWLCRSENINMWARYKPQITTAPIKMTPMSYSSRVGNTLGHIFGIKLPYCHLNVMNEVVHDLLTEEEDAVDWKYMPPRGGTINNIEEYFRLTDFVRNPDERTPSANGDPTPADLQGYNHYAPVPFVVSLDSIGITEKHSDEEGTWYEINKQLCSNLTFTFTNASGYDLHLQDFIDLAASYPNNVVWRPVLQVFNDADEYSEYTSRWEHWYERDHVDMQVAGDPITSTLGATWSVELPLEDFSPNHATYYNLCIGVGCCNSDFTSWKDDNQSLFILPRSRQQITNKVFPFYFKFSVVDHMERRLNFTNLTWFDTGRVQDVVAGGTAPYFEVTYGAGGVAWLEFTISKNNQKAHFISLNSTATSGYSPLRIQVRETVSGSYGENIYYLDPVTVAGYAAQVQPYAYIEEKTSSDPSTIETVTLYAKLEIELSRIPAGSTAQYHVYTKEGTAGDWVNNSYFSIRRASNQ